MGTCGCRRRIAGDGSVEQLMMAGAASPTRKKRPQRSLENWTVFNFGWHYRKRTGFRLESTVTPPATEIFLASATRGMVLDRRQGIYRIPRLAKCCRQRIYREVIYH